MSHHKFDHLFTLTLRFSPMGNCVSIVNAGEEAMHRAQSDEDHDGRKWAIRTQGGRAIVVGGKQGWFSMTEYGDIGISKTYTDNQFYQDNKNRIQAAIKTAMLEGFPLIGIANTLDAAVKGFGYEQVASYFFKIEEALRDFDIAESC